ncbi:MAG: hypothetical protein V8R97_06935 [Fusicatenibacter saccharivorans]
MRKLHFSDTFFHKRFFFYIHYSKNARPFAPRPLTDGFSKRSVPAHEFQNENHCTTYERSGLHRCFSCSRADSSRGVSDHVRSGKKDSAKKPSVTTAASAENARYIPGIYTSTISLGDQTFDVQVNVEQDRITAISLNNLSETTAAMYPLMEPALDSIASQIYVNQTTEGLIYGEDDRYTSELLVSAINQALEQAQNPSSAES